MYVSLLKNNPTYGIKNPDKWGVMIHSTGANNPYLKRYVPNTTCALIGENKYGNTWDRKDVDVSVHVFIGKMNDGSVEAVMTLPFDNIAWHAGSYQANHHYIAIEICEDGLDDMEYFNQTIAVAIKTVVEIMEKIGIKMVTRETLTTHAEGYEMGIASNHGDPNNWWSKFGYNINMFRKEVEMAMKQEEKQWYDEYMKEAAGLGLLTNERPNDPVTRAELAVVVMNLYNLLREG